MGVSPRTGDAHKGLCYKDLGAFLQFCPNAPLAQVHNLGAAAAQNVFVRLVSANGQQLAQTSLNEISALTGFDPQFREVRLTLPAGATQDDATLVVDPDNQIDELNESNNAYPLRLGVPPPVESSPGKPRG